jgi:hypothetical protein
MFSVRDYKEAAMHRFGDGGGIVETSRAREGGENLASSDGFGAWMRMGRIGSRRSVFVALFTDGKTLLFRYADRIVDCLANQVTASRERLSPGVKRFRFVVNGETVVDERYLWIDWRSWPDDGDILSHVERITKNRENMWFLVLLRAAAKRGDDVENPAALKELQRQAHALR